MLEKAKNLIRATINPHDKILVGLSGGADSIALVHLLYSMGYQILPMHINFHLRGEESDRDERFVKEFCQKHLPNTSLVLSSAQTETVAKELGISVEMAARDIRYETFRMIAFKQCYQWIAVAHHADDQVETALLNLSRGTGGVGLSGMKVVNGDILRPFLTTSKSELLEYIHAEHLEYITDSTNNDTGIKRNYIRHRLIPNFEELNPSFRISMLESMSHFGEEQEVLNEQKKVFINQSVDNDEQSIELGEVVKNTSGRYFFKKWVNDFGFNYTQAEDMLKRRNSEKSTSFWTGDTLAQIYRGKLFIIDNVSKNKSFEPRLLNDVNYLDTLTVYKNRTENHGTKTLLLSSAFRDKDVIVRMGKHEDVFQPFGMKQGHKSLFRYLGERGVPEYYRPFCPTLECEGEVIAVLPFEISECARAEDLDSALILSIEIMPTQFGTILSNLMKR